ncbi:MAG: hypothetical protein MHPSP_003053, partial [Paramarteilia canceri]
LYKEIENEIVGNSNFEKELNDDVQVIVFILDGFGYKILFERELDNQNFFSSKGLRFFKADAESVTLTSASLKRFFTGKIYGSVESFDNFG